MTKIPLKLRKWPKHPRNIKQMTKITPKPKNWLKYPLNLKINRNTTET